MSTPAEDDRPRSGAGIDPDRPAIHGERPSAVPGLAAGVIRRRPSGARPPLPKNLRGAARFWLAMISLLVAAPFLGLGAAGGSGSYVGKINDAARKLVEPAPSAGLAALIGAVSLLGSVWTLGLVRLAACAVLVIFRRWQHLLAFAGSVLVVGCAGPVRGRGRVRGDSGRHRLRAGATGPRPPPGACWRRRLARRARCGPAVRRPRPVRGRDRRDRRGGDPPGAVPAARARALVSHLLPARAKRPSAGRGAAGPGHPPGPCRSAGHRRGPGGGARGRGGRGSWMP